MEILKRDSLHEGGFAGLKEYQLVKEPELFDAPDNKGVSWSGIGHFVYLADARFMPHGETHMHKHHEIDVISVMVEGNIRHQGTLENGLYLSRNDVQVQRAGGEGFSHNEINPDDEWNRMIQLWVLPEVSGLAADYKVYTPTLGELTRVYGGEEDSHADFPAKTKIDVVLLKNGQQVAVDVPFLAYITRGTGIANNEEIEEGDLIRGDALKFEALDDVQLIVIHVA